MDVSTCHDFPSTALLRKGAREKNARVAVKTSKRCINTFGPHMHQENMMQLLTLSGEFFYLWLQMAWKVLAP